MFPVTLLPHQPNGFGESTCKTISYYSRGGDNNWARGGSVRHENHKTLRIFIPNYCFCVTKNKQIF
jgi:hypothetical protein